MTLAIMQPYFFPYIGYWQLIHAVERFIIYDDVHYINRGYINRNNILINGEKKLFTLELQGASQNKLIQEIKTGSNQKKLLKTVEMAYKKAPYFESTYKIIEDILLNQEKNLARFLGYSLKKISAYLGIKTDFIYSSDIVKNNNLRSQEKIIDIATHLQTTHYVNAIGGQDLYDKKRFSQENIKLSFLKTGNIEYKQFGHEFISHLSIIDVLMFNNIESIQKMLNNYELV